MIQKEYVMQMARYNAWQNNQLMPLVHQMSEADLLADRGAFFGSLFSTLNHILWGDTLWMSRWCSDVLLPSVPSSQHATFTPNIDAWGAERIRLDGRIRNWAGTVSDVELCDDLEWTSQMLGKTITQPLGLCVVHMFNHQTHHRGQISQMFSAAGLEPPVSDLVFMPDDA